MFSLLTMSGCTKWQHLAHALLSPDRFEDQATRPTKVRAAAKVKNLCKYGKIELSEHFDNFEPALLPPPHFVCFRCLRRRLVETFFSLVLCVITVGVSDVDGTCHVL